MYPVELTGARVRLQELSPALAAPIWSIVAAEEGIVGPHGFVRSEEELRDWLIEQHVHACSPGRVRYRWAIALLAGGDLVGSTRIYVESEAERQGSLGYALATPFRGKGYATEAAALALDFGFTDLGLHRVWATIEPDNAASLRVASRLGMRREGVLESRIKVGPDQWRDAYLYAITDREWRAR